MTSRRKERIVNASCVVCSDFSVCVTRLGIAGWQAMYLASFVNAIGSASESASALLLINNAATWVVDMCVRLCLRVSLSCFNSHRRRVLDPSLAHLTLPCDSGFRVLKTQISVSRLNLHTVLVLISSFLANEYEKMLILIFFRNSLDTFGLTAVSNTGHLITPSQPTVGGERHDVVWSSARPSGGRIRCHHNWTLHG